MPATGSGTGSDPGTGVNILNSIWKLTPKLPTDDEVEEFFRNAREKAPFLFAPLPKKPQCEDGGDLMCCQFVEPDDRPLGQDDDVDEDDEEDSYPRTVSGCEACKIVFHFEESHNSCQIIFAPDG